MDVEMIATEMSQRFHDSKLNWMLYLKRLEMEGYEVKKIKPEISATPCCFKCKKPILGQVIIENDIYYCHHCYYLKQVEDKLP